MMNNFRYENKTKVYFGKGSVGESLDPGYSLSVPFRQVVSGAFDILSHAMETYFGKPDENNLSDDINEAVMRSVIRNIRALLADHDNYEARSELAWASSMAENGILKIGKVTDFQCHMLEHQLGPIPTATTAQVWQSSIRRCTGTSALRMRAVSPAFPCVFCTPEKFEKSC